MQHVHYDKEQKIASLFKEDKSKFMQLPAQRYDNFRLKKRKADKYGFVSKGR